MAGVGRDFVLKSVGPNYYKYKFFALVFIFLFNLLINYFLITLLHELCLSNNQYS